LLPYALLPTICSVISGWQPIASIDIKQPFICSRLSKAGMAVISFGLLWFLICSLRNSIQLMLTVRFIKTCVHLLYSLNPSALPFRKRYLSLDPASFENKFQWKNTLFPNMEQIIKSRTSTELRHFRLNNAVLMS